jgi:hypothetical protein
MRKNKIITIVLVLGMLSTLEFVQAKKIKGTYLYSDNEEYIQIDKDLFKIIRTKVCIPCMDLDKGDSLASSGSVEYIKDGFIKLKSDIDSSIYKNTTVEELYDANIKDSVKIKFFFPFKGKYRIDAAIGFPYISTENDCITIPKSKYTLDTFNFNIYNLNIKYNGYNGEYFGRIVFYMSLYQFKNKNTNILHIAIPNLTNSYFARYLINGEYAKIEKNKIIWRNREYKKVSNDLINPKIELGDNAIDDVNGIDIIDK